MISEIPSRMDESAKANDNEWRAAPPTTAQELLGRNIKDSKGLNLSSARLDITQRTMSSGNILTRVDIDETIEGNTFLSFLNKIAPVTVDYSGAVTGDWILPDYTRGPMSQFNKERVRRHASMGADWGDFGANRATFISLLEEGGVRQAIKKTEEAIADSEVFKGKAVSLALKRALNSDFNSLKYKYKPWEIQIDAIKAEIAEYMHVHRDLWSRNQIRSGKQINLRASVYRFWHMKYDDARTDFFQNSSATKVLAEDESFVEEAIRIYLRGFDYREVKDNQGDSLYLRPDRSVYEPRLSQTEDGKISVGFKGQQPLFIAHFESQNGKPIMRIDHAPKYRIGEPVIVWETDVKTQERTFYVRPNTIDTGTDNPLIVRNSLLGFLVVPYLEPELREHWEKQLYLVVKDENGNEKRHGPQMNGPAQVPVYALMKRAEIAANSRLLQAVEDYMDAYAA